MVALVKGGARQGRGRRNLAREPRDTLTWSGAPGRRRGSAARAASADAPVLGGRRDGALGPDGGRPRVPARPVGQVRDRAHAVRPAARRRSRPSSRTGASGRTHRGGGHGGAAGVHVRGSRRRGRRRPFEIAVAKVRTGEAAGLGAGIAHQAHGAIGFTYEHYAALRDATALVLAGRVRRGELLVGGAGPAGGRPRRRRALAAHGPRLGESPHAHPRARRRRDLAHRRDRPLVVPHRPDAARVGRGADRVAPPLDQAPLLRRGDRRPRLAHPDLDRAHAAAHRAHRHRGGERQRSRRKLFVEYAARWLR